MGALFHMSFAMFFSRSAGDRGKLTLDGGQDVAKGEY